MTEQTILELAIKSGLVSNRDHLRYEELRFAELLLEEFKKAITGE